MGFGNALASASGFRDDEHRKLVAWQNASAVIGQDPAQVRVTQDGRFVQWSEYGRKSTYGWEVDHVVPLALGGRDISYNVCARHWHDNRSSGGILGNALRR